MVVRDIHLSDRAPSSCTDSYQDDLFDLLGHTVVLSEGCDAVAWASDIFHSKSPSRTSHRTVMRASTTFRPFVALLGPQIPPSTRVNGSRRPFFRMFVSSKAINSTLPSSRLWGDDVGSETISPPSSCDRLQRNKYDVRYHPCATWFSATLDVRKSYV